MKNPLPPLLPHERWLRAGCVAAAGLVIVLLMFRTGLPAFPCGFRSLTGLPCAMCGGTRSASALISGEWSVAFYMNPLAIFVVAGGLFLTGILLGESLIGRPILDWTHWKKRVGKLLPVSLLLLVCWWMVHVVLAVKSPKPELIDLRNPVAARVAAWLAD